MKNIIITLVALSFALLTGCFERDVTFETSWTASSSHDGDPIACPSNHIPDKGTYEFKKVPSEINDFDVEKFEVTKLVATVDVTGDQNAIIGYDNYDIAYGDLGDGTQFTPMGVLVTSAEVGCATPITITNIDAANACLELMRVYINTEARAIELRDFVKGFEGATAGIEAGGAAHCSSSAQDLAWDATWTVTMEMKAVISVL